MKASSASPVTPFVLKTTGIMLILLYLLDFLLVLLSPKFQDSQWVLAFTTQLIDRGFLPLIGLAILSAAFWMEGESGNEGSNSRGLKLISLVLASALGLGFLLLIPLHVSTARTAVDDQLKRVEQEATQAESQLNAQAGQQLDSNIAQIEQALKSGQLGEQQAQAQKKLDELKKLKADPKAFEASIAPQKEQVLKQVKGRRQEVETQLRDTSLRSGLRAGLGGLLLAIAHAAIGWTGLRQLTSTSGPRI
jgi:hypothetical protein